VKRSLADRICNFNRHWAEPAGYFATTRFLKEAGREHAAAGDEIAFYDSNTGKPLFYAPIGRTWEEFLQESRNHGWPSFRDAEVEWSNVRCLRNGEVVSLDGTHLGHNLPDRSGNRYCINLVSIAGRRRSVDEDGVGKIDTDNNSDDSVPSQFRAQSNKTSLPANPFDGGSTLRFG